MIIGITGTNGAGKGTVVDYLVTKGFKHYSARAIITEELVKRGLPVDRTNMNFVGNDLRKMHGPGYMAEESLRQAKELGSDAVFESVRSIGEASYLKSQGGVLWAVDADRKERYNRILLRGSGTDKVSFDEFAVQEDREMNQTEPWDMNVFGVIKMADAVFHNDGTLDELYAHVDAALAQFTK